MKDSVVKFEGFEFVKFAPIKTMPKQNRPLSVRVNNSTYFGMEKSGFNGQFLISDTTSRHDQRSFAERIKDVSNKDLPISIIIRTERKRANYRSVCVLKDYRLVNDKDVGLVLGGSLKSSSDCDSRRFKEAISKLSPRIRNVFKRNGIDSFKAVIECPEIRFAAIVGVGEKQIREYVDFRDSLRRENNDGGVK